MVKLTSRLRTAADLCRRGVTVCDVGTDHALLACYLAQTGAKSVIASDVREGPLSAARRTIAEQGVANVAAVLSDGLEKIDYADDVVICGMGGELIMKIISGCRFLSEDTRFILQPMTSAEDLRELLYLNGFEIIEERAAREGDRFYTIMLVKYTGVKRRIDDVFMHCGKITDADMLRKISAKLRRIADGQQKAAQERPGQTDEGDMRAAENTRSLADRIDAHAREIYIDRGMKWE